jgi:hypothetical protein
MFNLLNSGTSGRSYQPDGIRLIDGGPASAAERWRIDLG